MCQVWSVAVMGVAWQDIHRCWVQDAFLSAKRQVLGW